MTIGLSHAQLFLIDRWPGIVTNGPNPSSWTTYSATEDFPLGTKRAIYDDTHNGFATLMYLKYVKGTAAYATVRQLCGIVTSTMATVGDVMFVSNDGGECQLLGPIAVCLGTTSATALYGWFWVGGVCPSDTIATLDDALYGTDGSITAGTSMVMADSASYLKFHLGAATDICSFSAYALAADTTS